MKIFFICEDGNDVGIESFHSYQEAKTYAEKDDRVKVIFEYEEDDKGDIEGRGVRWRRR